MNNSVTDEQAVSWKSRYLGFLILLACILGGGATQNLWSDQLIVLVMFPAIYMGFVTLLGGEMYRSVRVFTILVLLFLIFQFLPFVPERNLPVFEKGFSGQFLFSTTVSRSLEAALLSIAALGLGLFVSSLSDRQHRKIVGYVLLGLLINIAVSLVQFSYDGNTDLKGLLPYTISSGMFANENHFSTLGLLSIPLMAWLFLDRSKSYLAFFLIQLLFIIYLFALGSRAASILAFPLAALCFFWFVVKSNKTVKLTVLLLAVPIFFVIISQFDDQTSFGKDGRWQVYNNTLHIISQQLPFGTGLGSFVEIYKIYLPLKQLNYTYMNAAHNDLLQLVLEGGVFAGFLVVFYLVLLFRNMFSDHFRVAVGLSLLVIVAHSLLDYPLRTMAILTIFSALSGIALRKPVEKKETPPRRREVVYSEPRKEHRSRRHL